MRLFRKRAPGDIATAQRELAALLVRTAGQLGAEGLDFTPESVEALDSLVDGLWDPAEPPGEDELDTLTKLMGAYMGEVMIRTVGGEWAVLPDGRGMPAIRYGEGKFAPVLDKVYRRQVHGREDSLVDYYRRYQERFREATKP